MAGCPELTERWPLRQFLVMMHYLHLNGNTTQKDYGEPGYDPFHKVRPVLQQFKKNCLMQYKPIRSNSISEVEIGFKKKDSQEQTVHSK